MKLDDKKEFGLTVKSVYDYYEKSLTADILSMWWSGLQDLELGEIRVALNRHVQNPDSGQFLPRIADVRKMLGGTTQDVALQAWAKVSAAIRGVGPMYSVCFDDALIHACVVEMGGWVKLCNTPTEEDLNFRGKEFENRYRAHARLGHTPAYEPVMIGMSEAHNAPKSLPIAPPKYLGDAAKALSVRAKGAGSGVLQITSGEDIERLRLAVKAA